MKKKYILGIIAAVAALLTGCLIYQRLHVEFHADENGRSVSIIGGADGPTSIFLAGKIGGEKETVTFTSITMEEAKEIFAVPGDYIILDVRRSDEYSQGHIPGAINVANESIENEEPEELPDKEQTIYVYCRSGRRSQEAASKLAAL